MINTCVLVGFIESEPVEVKEDGRERYLFKVSSERPYRENDGTIHKDILKVYIWKGKAMEMKETCHRGSLIAIKGRLTADSRGECAVNAESVTALSRNRILAACRYEGYDTMHV